MRKTLWQPLGIALAIAIAGIGMSSMASAQIFDGFGDGDRNNDGAIDLLDADTNNVYEVQVTADDGNHDGPRRK